MRQLYRWSIRPYYLFLYLAIAFAAGILTDRSGRFIQPYHYVPSGVEKTFAPFWEAWDLVNKRFVNREAVEPTRMTQGAIEGMLASLGDWGHTRYVPPNDIKGLEERLEGRLEGIGAGLGVRNGKPTIENTMPGSPARAAGLKPGDVLLEVQGKSVATMPLGQIVDLVRGEPDSKVKLRVAREGASEPLEFSIARAHVSVPDASWAMLPGLPIAHIAVHSFGFSAEAQLKKALADARKAGAKGLVIDVRRNPGGIKDQAVAVASEFLKDGNVVIELDAQGNRKTIPVTEGGSATDLPLAVLVDEGSASAAEIFAGAIQDHRRGKLVGKKTNGQGTVLEPFSLSDGSALLLAVAEWLTPEGREIWHKGISPDIEVTLPTGAIIVRPDAGKRLDAAGLKKSDDTQLLKAIDILKSQIQ